MNGLSNVAQKGSIMSTTLTQKRCKSCNEEKPLDEFFPRKKAPDGREYHCRACDRIRLNKLNTKKREQRIIDRLLDTTDWGALSIEACDARWASIKARLDAGACIEDIEELPSWWWD